MLELLTANITGQGRTEVLNGKEYFVTPITFLVPGVLPGSKGELFYPHDEVAKNPGVWNAIPLVVYHPTKDGKNVSARDPEILNASGIGFAFKDGLSQSGARGGEGWFDIEATTNYDRKLTAAGKPAIMPRLRAGEAIELSTGLWTDNFPVQNGQDPKTGRKYHSIARNYRPDHIAILPDQQGACSIKDGCGVGVQNAADEVCSNCQNPKHKGPCKGSKHGVSTKKVQLPSKRHILQDLEHNPTPATAAALQASKSKDDKAAVAAHDKAARELKDKYLSSKDPNERAELARKARLHDAAAGHHAKKLVRNSLTGNTMKCPDCGAECKEKDGKMTCPKCGKVVQQPTSNTLVGNCNDDGMCERCKKKKAVAEPDKPKSDTTTNTTADLTTNRGAPVPKNMTEWLAEMPDDAKPIWNTAVSVHNREVDDIVAKLTVNVAEGEQKKQLVANLTKKGREGGIDELRQMLSLLPQPAPKPTTNASGIVIPNYGGAGNPRQGAPTANGKGGGKDDEPLRPVVLNMREVSDEQFNDQSRPKKTA